MSDLHKRLRRYVEGRELAALLDRIPDLTFIKFVPDDWDDLIPPAARHDVLGGRKPPTATIPWSSPKDEVLSWVQEQWAASRITGLCYLSLYHHYHFAPWAEVQVSSTGSWLVELWDKLGPPSLTVVSGNRGMVFDLTDLEYEYEVVIRHIE